MDFYTQYKNIYSKVKHILTEDPKARDNDLYLLSKVWDIELAQKNADCTDVLPFMETNQLTTPESVRRARQKLQEKYLDFRGRTYNKRHRLEQFVRSDINKEDE